MPIELHVIRASEFIKLDAHERLDFESSKQALQALARACHKRAVDSALLDLRSRPVPTKRLFTTTELAALIQTFREAGFSKKQRLAVLYHQDVYGGVRDFAFIGRMGGLQVRAFRDFEEALEWLSEEKEDSVGKQPGEVPVPITQVKREAKKVPVELTAGGTHVRTSRPARGTPDRAT
jgi:hypothetical protein